MTTTLTGQSLLASMQSDFERWGLAALKRLVDTPSSSTVPDIQGIWSCAQQVESICKTMPEVHVQIVNVDGWPIVVAGKGDPKDWRLMISAHLDTVLNTTETFKFGEDAHNIYGPGAGDDKGAVISALMALQHMPAGTVAIFDPDEEIASPKGMQYIRGVAQAMRHRWFDEGGAWGLVLEGSQTPAEVFKIGRCGTARLRERWDLDRYASLAPPPSPGTEGRSFTVTYKGVPAHSGVAFADGISAVDAAANDMIRMADWAAKRKIHFEITSFNGGMAVNRVPGEATLAFQMCATPVQLVAARRFLQRAPAGVTKDIDDQRATTLSMATRTTDAFLHAAETIRNVAAQVKQNFKTGMSLNVGLVRDGVESDEIPGLPADRRRRSAAARLHGPCPQLVMSLEVRDTNPLRLRKFVELFLRTPARNRSGFLDTESWATTKETVGLAKVYGQARKTLGLGPAFGHQSRGVSLANRLAPYLTVVDGIGPEGGADHTEGDWVSKVSIVRCAAALIEMGRMLLVEQAFDKISALGPDECHATALDVRGKPVSFESQVEQAQHHAQQADALERQAERDAANCRDSLFA